MYYREEDEDDQEEEAAKKKSKVRSLEGNLSLKWLSTPIDMCQFDFKTNLLLLIGVAKAGVRVNWKWLEVDGV